METKRDKFIRLAEARTNKAIEMIRLIGNLPSTSSHEYTDEDVKQIFSVLEKELKLSKNKFYGIESKDKVFHLR